ncbi:S8 family peptidase [Tessaracoccus sp. G1721]
MASHAHRFVAARRAGGRALAALALALSLAVIPGPASGAPSDTATYVVQFRDGVNARAEAATGAGRGLAVGRVLTNVYPGMVATMNQAQAAALARNPRVVLVEKDQVFSISDTQTGATWGLDRIDQRLRPLDASYSYGTTGDGITAYVIDTGVLAAHADFGGRVTGGYDFIDNDAVPTDCNGHGTHVAGTVGGMAYGVAKAVSIVPVRVLNCSGSGTTSQVVAGLDWVAGDHTTQPAVANMSLGGAISNAIDAAVVSVISDGVSVVVAAGNSSRDACFYSPARVKAAITVAATTSTDARASFSNYGSCVDVFAPGASITSAWIGSSNTATRTISGTSMAAPHVAGAVARLLDADSALTTSQVSSAITSNATTGVVSSAGRRSPNLLLYAAPSS